ncbi:Pentacotripeptide-repeat region of PRORP domain-containing protein [Plasmodiophora brassicae]|uniref:Pentacotripeptide-repeat region of PRORP domain-containing protein n=1 Tax=Plasmodiophora brassicae TaxID=37360 RepID=A0A0G4ILZ8_PLABS|nr:hypothetical protein PBRA_004874 [Plasmodiophora brassicae]SPQ99136.1 unnamed protein product [Plasmodiophora brassicae]
MSVVRMMTMLRGVRVRAFSSAAMAEVSRVPGGAGAMMYDSGDSRLAPDRAKMLSKFWTLRQYAKQPELCQGPRAFEDEFKALSTEYGYCPVDYRLKVEFYSKRGDARTVVSTLNEMRRVGVVCDLATYNVALESLATHQDQEKQCRKILSQMTGTGVPPDQTAFCSVLSAHVTNRSTSLAITLLDKMLRLGFYPPSEIVNDCLGMLVEGRLLEETTWLLECTLQSPYPTVEADIARQVVTTFGDSMPTMLITKSMGNFRLEPVQDLLSELLRVFANNSEMKSFVERIQVSGNAPACGVDSTLKSPKLSQRILDVHNKKASTKDVDVEDRRPAAMPSRSGGYGFGRGAPPGRRHR